MPGTTYPGLAYPGEEFTTATVIADVFHVIDGGRGVLPQLCVEIDFTNDPTNSTRVWTDVTTDIRQLAYIGDGRLDALQRASTGTLQAVMNNRAGAYDPLNTAGAHYPGVKRLRWIRVRGRWNGNVFSRWEGVVESWTMQWPEAGKDAVTLVQAASASKVLNLFDLSGKSYPSQTTSARVTAVCADVGLSSSVTTGADTLPASGTFAPGSFALSHLQQVEETENGRLFTAGDATVTFQDRHYRALHSGASSGTIGDAAGEIPYQETELDLDDVNIWNLIQVTPAGGTTETASSASSQTSYYQRAFSRSLLTTSQSEALSAANWLLALYKDSEPRLPVLTVLPSRTGSTSLWPTVLGATISQRFTWKRRPVYGGTISLDGFVEQVGDTIVPGESWDVSLQLLPALDQSLFWVLGDAVYGLLGQTTVLGY